MAFFRSATLAAAALTTIPFALSCSLAFSTDSVQCETTADCEARGEDLAGTVCEANVCVKKATTTTTTTTTTGECTTDADCQAKGAAHAKDVCVSHVCEAPPDPKWGCIGNVEPLPAGKMYTITTQLLDVVTNQPITGVTVKLCNKYDAPCATPIGMPTLGADGRVTVTVPSEIESYLEVTGGGYYPTLAFNDHLAQSKNEVVLVATPAIVDSLAGTAGVTVDPTKGIILLRTVDCTLAPTAGASTTVFPGDKETRFYIISSTANPNATQTDSAGNSGFVNVTPGTVTVTGTVGPMGTVFGKTSVLVRAGAISAQILRPTPAL